MTTRRYLLVDDNREFAENMAEILTDEGADVTRAVDGPSALSALDHGPFDVMITDMRMPGVTGAELLKLVRVRDPGLPVVVVSAYTRDEQLEEAHRLGLLAFMLKTASPAKLLELLERARRDAVVLAVCDDEARIERAREALERGQRGRGDAVLDLGEHAGRHVRRLGQFGDGEAQLLAEALHLAADGFFEQIGAARGRGMRVLERQALVLAARLALCWSPLVQSVSSQENS